MIDYIELSGFKSFALTQRVRFAGLTLLAGANSSGKSSLMQPLLLLKQTLECPYDPGAVLLDGPNIKLTASKQAITTIKGNVPNNSFRLAVGMRKADIELTYRRSSNGAFQVDCQRIRRRDSDQWISLSEGKVITPRELRALGEGKEPVIPAEFVAAFASSRRGFEFKGTRERSFLRVSVLRSSKDSTQAVGLEFPAAGDLPAALKRMYHIPGLRGNPERDYRATEVANQFPGTYETYVASILWKWQIEADTRLVLLGEQLRSLGLTWKVEAKKVQDTRVELRVGRLSRAARGGARDLVSLADVGLGVAQILPILVALLSATKNQIVYIEQPELHLHPRAQSHLASIFTAAVARGIKVIVETHSSVLLRGIQTAIAKREMKASDVSFNWFSRNASTGATEVTSVVPDSVGAFGDWPADFDDVTLEVEGAYLDAVEGAS